MTVEKSVRQIADAVDAALGEVQDGIAALRQEVLRQWPARGRLPGTLALDASARAELARAIVMGSGFVAAPDAVTEPRFAFQWWTRKPGSTEVSVLRVQTDPRATDYRDYTTLAWYDGPARTGEPTLIGPYVDYICTQEYALTLTVPVVAGGRFVGVAGADVDVDALDRVLADELAAPGSAVAVVNATGRVVMARGGGASAGDLLRAPGAPEASWTRLSCARVPLHVVVRQVD